MTVLFWDIDGTLLTTGKAGVPAWEEAVKEVIGRDFQLSKFRIAGLTDYRNRGPHVRVTECRRR